MSNPIVIIGGGLAGLTCATQLHEAGIEFVLLEASDSVGGRVRTDNIDGFLLDRGFQVLLTAYPEAQRLLDYDALNLQAFEPGSIIRTDGRIHRISDPWRRPQNALQTAFAQIGGFADKLRIGRLRWDACRGPLEQVFQRPDRTTEKELTRRGFTPDMVEKFLRPFLGGVFLDADLQTSCRMMSFVFRMFSQGDTALPANGMGTIPRQLAERLPQDSIRLSSPVNAIDSGRVTLNTGTVIPSDRVIIATEQSAAAKLLPELASSRSPRSVRCLYFSASEPPIEEKMLVLNGTGHGVVNNLCIPSQVAKKYAPVGKSLISATVLKSELVNDDLLASVTEQMREWFGASVDDWQHLRTYTIPYALPNQMTPAFDPPLQPVTLRDDILVCGDYRTNGSINGAMQSGRLVAEEILRSR